VNRTRHSFRWRAAGLTLALATALTTAEAIAPTLASADTGGTNTVKVLNAPTINPPATGGTFSVTIAANAATSISGAGTGLQFDKTKLQVTALAKDATEAANGATYIGFPSSGSMAAFIANANANGLMPNISWAYLDGTSSEVAGADHGVYSVTFQVTALGDSSLTPADSPAILDGSNGTYGQGLSVTPVAGHVVNSASAAPTAAITPARARSPMTSNTARRRTARPPSGL
jgi:hypothetical protein